MLISTKHSNDHRHERRGRSRAVGRYTLSVINGGAVSFREGTLTILNKSKEGMLVHFSERIKPNQILEVTFLSGGRQSTTSLLEVCWTKPLSVGRGRPYYHVGCRTLLSFKPAFSDGKRSARCRRECSQDPHGFDMKRASQRQRPFGHA